MTIKSTITALLLIIFTYFCLFYFFYTGKEAQSTTLNVYEKITMKKAVNYLIVGDSIGRGAGVDNSNLTWFSQWEAQMKKNYGIDLYRHSIVQSGATAFEGLYLFKKASKPTSVDLVILIFGENDRKYMSAKQFSSFYEALILEIKNLYPKAELMTITESCLNDISFANTIEKLANHYQANHVDMRIPFQNSGKTTAQLSDDLTHPNGLGYRLYADALLVAIEKSIQGDKQLATLQEPLTINSDMKLQEIKQYKEKNGPFLKLNSYYSTREKGSSLSYQFTGSNLGVKVLKSEEGGEMDVFIDGQFVRRISTWWPIRRERMIYITSDLPDSRT